MGFAQLVKFLLDTHAVLWVVESSPRLSARVRTLARTHEAGDFGLAAFRFAHLIWDGGEISVVDKGTAAGAPGGSALPPGHPPIGNAPGAR